MHIIHSILLCVSLYRKFSHFPSPIHSNLFNCSRKRNQLFFFITTNPLILRYSFTLNYFRQIALSSKKSGVPRLTPALFSTPSILVFLNNPKKHPVASNLIFNGISSLIYYPLTTCFFQRRLTRLLFQNYQHDHKTIMTVANSTENSLDNDFFKKDKLNPCPPVSQISQGIGPSPLTTFRKKKLVFDQFYKCVMLIHYVIPSMYSLYINPRLFNHQGKIHMSGIFLPYCFADVYTRYSSTLYLLLALSSSANLALPHFF